MDRSHRADLVVVGGGIAGLVTAITAAERLGERVVLLDAGPGRARTTEHEGVRLNEGPHALYLDGVLARTLRSWGIEPAGGAPDLSDFWAIDGERRTRFPVSARALAATGTLGVRGKLAFARLQMQLPRMHPADLAGRSVSEWLEGYPLDVQRVLRALVRVTTYVNAPALLDAGATLAQLQAAARDGVRYLDGGWSTIVEALHDRLARTGAQVLRSAPVTAVSQDADGGVRVITADGSHDARAVVLATGGPDTAARLLGIDAPPGWRTTPVEASCLDLWLSEPPRGAVTFDLDRDLYASVHAPVARLAPDGVTLLSVLHYLPAGEAPAAPDDERGLLLAHATRAGVDGGAVLGRRYLHRMTVAHGFPLAARRGAGPAVDSTGVPGVFVAGDWVGSGSMLADASAASGLAAAEAALAHRATPVGARG